MENEDAKKKKKKRKSRNKAGGVKQQTERPSIPVSELFPDGNFPIGEIMDYPPAAGIDERTAKNRFTSEEARALDRMHSDIYNEARQAAEAHRQTRKHIMKWVYDFMYIYIYILISLKICKSLIYKSLLNELFFSTG